MTHTKSTEWCSEALTKYQTNKGTGVKKDQTTRGAEIETCCFCGLSSSDCAFGVPGLLYNFTSFCPQKLLPSYILPTNPPGMEVLLLFITKLPWKLQFFGHVATFTEQSPPEAFDGGRTKQEALSTAGRALTGDRYVSSL